MRQDGFRIRELGSEDHDALLSLWERAVLHSVKPHGRDSPAALVQQHATGVQTILGLEMGSQLIAAVIVTHDSRKGWINRLAVDPAHRRQGYALRLVRAAEALLRRQGIRIVAALVMSNNAPSLALFQRAGYIEVDQGIHYLTKRDSDEA